MNNETPEQAAAREFIEETLALVGDITKGNYSQAIETMALTVQQAFPIENIMNKNSNTCRHVTYLLPVPYKDYPRHFQTCRQRMIAMDSVFQLFHKAKKIHLENISKILLPGSTISNGLVVRDTRVLNDKEVEIEIWCDADATKSYHVFVISNSMMNDFKRLIEKWRALVRFVEQNIDQLPVDHPATHIFKVGGAVCNAYVDRNFLEKSQLQWWTLRELRQISENKNSYRTLFRPQFLEFMDCIVSTIDSAVQSNVQQGDLFGLHGLPSSSSL